MRQMREAMEVALEQKCYHRKLGLPADIPKPEVGMRLHYSGHASRRNLSRPGRLPQYELVEVTTRHGEIYRWLVRFPWGQHDLVLAINPRGDVLTAYQNARGDNHETLRSSRYQDPSIKA